RDEQVRLTEVRRRSVVEPGQRVTTAARKTRIQRCGEGVRLETTRRNGEVLAHRAARRIHRKCAAVVANFHGSAWKEFLLHRHAIRPVRRTDAPATQAGRIELRANKLRGPEV